ncbi:hypothetical protein [Rhizobium jaguaris]|nr:hypothetical protein [Rhizobium jaguaris]
MTSQSKNECHAYPWQFDFNAEGEMRQSASAILGEFPNKQDVLE